MKKIILLSGLLIGLFSGINLAQGQSAIIQGKIVDAQTQETLPSVNIVEIDKTGQQRLFKKVGSNALGSTVYNDVVYVSLGASILGYDLNKFSQ